MSLEINADVSIDEDELEFTYSRSSGPGGQHVNKVETRVTLLFDVEASASLSDAQKARIHQRLATRITRDGVLRVASQRHRSRARNREAAVERFCDLLREALVRRRRRKKTRVPAGAKRRRLESKRKRSEVKRTRSAPRRDD